MIRGASLDDCDAITKLNAELGYPATSAAMRLRLEGVLGAPLQAVFVADTDSTVIGWIHVAVVENLEADRFAEIRGLIVAETRRGAGIGAQLVAAAERWAQQHEIRRMRVRSNITRERARRFYERIGYSVTKTQNVFDRDLTSSTD